MPSSCSHQNYLCLYMGTSIIFRYIAIRCPISYHNSNSGLNPWRRAFSLSLPVVVFATVFVLPIFFEANLEAKVVAVVDQEEVRDDYGVQSGFAALWIWIYCIIVFIRPGRIAFRLGWDFRNETIPYLPS